MEGADESQEVVVIVTVFLYLSIRAISGMLLLRGGREKNGGWGGRRGQRR